MGNGTEKLTAGLTAEPTVSIPYGKWNQKFLDDIMWGVVLVSIPYGKWNHNPLAELRHFNRFNTLWEMEP